MLSLITFLPADAWWIRVFDFPHIQLTILTLTAIATYFFRFDIKRWQDYFFMVIMLACFVLQFVKIAPYTAFYEYEIGESQNENASQISFFTANVLQKNEKYNKVIQEINRYDADVIVFTETNQKWMQAIKKELPNAYQYEIEIPLDNTYGMLLYSKFELQNGGVQYLINDTIPSIHTEIVVDDKKVQLHAIHPTPPMPQHNPESTERDAEMMKTAFLSKDRDMPVVVIGDFNDVPWSESMLLFQDIAMLQDVRVGRGFYNTFNATNPIMRWPLDHIFTSEEFRLKEIHLGEKTGSDHFPFYVNLSLEPEVASEQLPKEPSKEKLKTARKQLAAAKKSN